MSAAGAGSRELLDAAREGERGGRFREAETLLERARTAPDMSPADLPSVEFERERLDRIRRDFRLSRVQVLDALEEGVRDFQPIELDRWIAEGVVDRRVIDGEERFFVSSLSNLFFRRPGLESRRLRPRDIASRPLAYWEQAVALRTAARASGSPYVLPRTLRVRMTLTVAAEAAAPGRRVSAWLPVPRRYPHQDGFRLLRTKPGEAGDARVDSEDSAIRSVFLEQAAPASGPTVFEIEYEYTARGVSFDLSADGSRRAASGSPESAAFLGEGPHVVFTPEMRALAARLAAGETRPVARARRFHEWIASNIRYSFAPEYSTVRNLAEACRADGRGDCGQAALLFMTLCRVSGIPARWQSGWSLFPGDETIHDWCEIRLEPWGWVPVDPYMGMLAMQYAPALSPSQRTELRDFYFGGLNPERMAANADHSQELRPARRAIRSDPVDFQRGEVEVDGRNVYFDRFDYHLTWGVVPSK